MKSSCGLCGKHGELELIDKRIKGEFTRVLVCAACKHAHERELELTRENFRRQFGEK